MLKNVSDVFSSFGYLWLTVHGGRGVILVACT